MDWLETALSHLGRYSAGLGSPDQQSFAEGLRLANPALKKSVSKTYADLSDVRVQSQTLEAYMLDVAFLGLGLGGFALLGAYAIVCSGL